MTVSRRIYVGSSIDIKKRLLCHTLKNIDPVVWIYLLEIGDIKLAMYIEDDIIKRVKPELNKYPHMRKYNCQIKYQ